MRIFSRLMFAALSGALALPCLAADETKVETGQHARTFEKQITLKLDYLLSLPPTYGQEAGKKWPVILFLHGSGERGSDVQAVKKHGPPAVVAKDPTGTVASEFIVISPQCPAGRWWKPDELIALVDDVSSRYGVDNDRVYLTGLSMGGFGTWDLASNYPDRFAAIAPMCGGGNTAMVRRLKKLPIWIFHGAADHTVPVERSDEMNAALKKIGADVQYTRYDGVDHDCWTRSYNNPDLYTWFLSHKRGDEAKPAAPKTDEPAPPTAKTR